MSGPHVKGGPLPSIVTRAELEQRLAARPAPAPERTLKPDSSSALDVRRQLDAAAEERIKFLQHKLEQERVRALRDHTFANLAGRAKGDFGRSR